MARIGSPSTVMYAKLKEFGISNREAASMLLNTELTFDGRSLRSRIDDSSQLSRRIVHTAPEEIPQQLFNDFASTCTQIENRALYRASLSRTSASLECARKELSKSLSGECAANMMRALRSYNVDDSLYRDATVYVERASLPHEEDRTLLHLMLFVATGCLGNPRLSTDIVVRYATEELGADFHTAPTVMEENEHSHGSNSSLLGLVRVSNGRVTAGSKMHILNPEGTEIGLLPIADHIVADVDADVSRRHAYIWRDGDHWYVRDLGSTNGTMVVSGSDGSSRAVGTSTPAELSPSDVVCLGATTRFIVMPVLGT